MEAQAENIEHLSRAILEEARAEAEGIRAEAQAKSDEILKRAKEQAEAETKAILAKAGQEAERLRGQAVAAAQLKARALQLEHREKLLDGVFKAAAEKLADIPKRPDYDGIAARLLREALAQLRVAKAEVRAEAATAKVLTEAALKKIAGDLKVELTSGKPLEEGTGLMVDSAEGHLHFDNTFENRLSRLQNALRSAVYKVLMGEKL